MSDDRLIITAEEAAALLHEEGEYVHNYLDGGMIMIGCDVERADAIEAFSRAHLIEIGGSGCKSMRHPIVVWDKPNHYSFYEADMAKVEAFEASKQAADA